MAAAAVVRSVWDGNFEAEGAVLREVAKDATHVAFNVQYPGCVVHCGGRHYGSLATDERYALVRANVDPMQPLQVGLAVRTGDGRLLAWQFNLCDFDMASHAGCYRRAPDSVAYLASRGVDFWRLKYDGVPGYRLRWLLRDAGLIRARPEWATFAGGYHAAYLLKMMTGERLPADLGRFMALLGEKIAGRVYDVKVMAREHGLGGPLKLIAEQLGAAPLEEAAGTELAGADAVLALQAFEALKDKTGGDTGRFRNRLSGLQVY